MFKKNYYKSNIPFFLVIPFGILVFFLILFSIFDSVHASSDVQVNYPFIIDEERNPTELSLDDIRDGFSEYFGNLPDHYIIYCAVIGDFYANGPHGWDYYPYYNFIISVNPVFDYPSTPNENSSFSIVNSTEYSFDYNTWYGGWASWQVNPNVRHTYTYSQLFNNGFGYILYGTEDYYQNYNDVVVWSYPPSDVLDPAAPDLTGLDLDSSLNTTQVPTAPTYSNSFNTPLPTYDSTAPIESLVEIIVWGFNRIHSFWQSFIEYLFSWFTYFVNILTYLIQKIINALKYIVNWFYEQFLNWLNPYLQIWQFIKGILFNDEDQLSVFDVLFNLLNFVISWLRDFWDNSFISDFWDNIESYFSNLFTFFRVVVSLGIQNGEFSLITLFSNVFRILFIPDSDDLSDLLVSHDIYGVLGFAELVQTNVNYIKSLLSVNTRSVNYKFTLPDITIMGVQCGSYDIDFSWYLNYKNVGDPIISAFLIFGWFLWIHGRLPYWLRGQQGDVSNIAREVQK